MRVSEEDITFSGVAAPGLSVEPAAPGRLVFWREAQYVCCFDIGGVWVTSEWFETLGNNSPYDYEPISDKGTRHTFPRAVEVGPARVVVHWQYALCDSTPEAGIFHGNTTADEYYYIYPDGFTVRKLVGWPGVLHEKEGDPLLWETGEIIIINPKGTTSQENIEPHAATYRNLGGDEYRQLWDRSKSRTVGQESTDVASLHAGPLCILHPSSAAWEEYIITANLAGRPRFFMVFPNNQEQFPSAPCQAGCVGGRHPTIQLWRDYPSWKHWPLWKEEYHIARSASEADMRKGPSHTSLASIDPYMHPGLGKKGADLKQGPFWTPPRPSTWIFLIGISSAPENFVRELARSWLKPAPIRDCPHFRSYDLSQRAYLFDRTGTSCAFTVVPLHPLINPVFILEGWQSPRLTLKLDGVVVGEPAYARSWRDQRLVLWLSASIARRTRVEISAW